MAVLHGHWVSRTIQRLFGRKKISDLSIEGICMNYREKILTGEEVITYSQLVPDCIPDSCIDLRTSVIKEIGPATCNSGFCVQDVNQGALRDCYLMAGLASVAFAAPGTMATKYAAMASTIPDKKIPVKGGTPCYARIGPRNVIWPLVYERAYAKQKGCDPCSASPPTRPTCIEGGAGIKALTEITGWPKVEIPISTFDPASADPAKKIPNTNGIATVPAVAWTTGGDPGNKIYGDHTYSYLGHVGGYVILKNPCSTAGYPTTYRLTSGTWSPNCCLTVNFSTPNYGIFGLNLTYFKSKFAGIGYVTQR